MEEKRITKTEFDAAVTAVIEKLASEIMERLDRIEQKLDKILELWW